MKDRGSGKAQVNIGFLCRVYSRIQKPGGIFYEKSAFYLHFNISTSLSI